MGPRHRSSIIFTIFDISFVLDPNSIQRSIQFDISIIRIRYNIIIILCLTWHGWHGSCQWSSGMTSLSGRSDPYVKPSQLRHEMTVGHMAGMVFETVKILTGHQIYVSHELFKKSQGVGLEQTNS